MCSVSRSIDRTGFCCPRANEIGLCVGIGIPVMLVSLP
jgi:hypothetical protein